MLSRLLTALVGIPLFLGALLLGGPWWLMLLLLLGLIGTAESARLMAAGRHIPLYWASQLLVFAMIVGAYVYSGDDRLAVPRLLVTIAVGLMVLFAWGTLFGGLHSMGTLRNRFVWMLVAFYPGLFLAHLVLLRATGLPATLTAVLVTWATDTGAFFVGSWVGRIPLWPAVSPKKTVEGAVGGLVMGTLTAMGIAGYYGLPVGTWAGIGSAAAIAAQIGDLVESAWKRRAGVKDAGRLLPGHGGVLDRFDSLFFSGAIVYFLYTFLE